MSISKEEQDHKDHEEQLLHQEEHEDQDHPDTHQFHSPLNSNAIITITTSEPIDIQPLLINHGKFELLPSSPPYIKIKFMDKQQAQDFQSKVLEKYPSLTIQIEFDALTHPGNIYVRGLGPEITTQDLYKIFEPFGEITSSKIVNDEYGRSKGYGFINFLEGQSAEEAINKLNGLLVNGSKLYLNHHIAKKERLERMDFEKSNFTNLYIKNLPIDYDLEQFEKLFAQFGEINSTFLPEIQQSPSSPQVQQQPQPQEDGTPSSINSSSSTTTTANNKRFGFVNYKNHESAMNAIEALDNKEITPDHILSVSRAQRRDERNEAHHHHPFHPRNNSISPTPGPILFPMINSPPNTAPMTSITRTTPPTSIHSITSPIGSIVQPVAASTAAPIISLPLPGPNHQPSNLYVRNLSVNIDDSSLHSAFAPFGIIVSAKIMTTDEGESRGYGFVCYRTSPEASRALLAMNGNVLDGQVLHVSFAQKNTKRKYINNNRLPGGPPPGALLPNNMGPGPAGNPNGDYPFYYNSYQDPGFPIYYSQGPAGAANQPGIPPHVGAGGPNNGFIPAYGFRSYGNNGYANSKPYYSNKPYNNNSHNNHNHNGSNGKVDYNKRIVKLTSEISNTSNEDEKIEKISKFLILPKLLNLGEIENVESKAVKFVKDNIEKYQESTSEDNRDVYLDLINDWANDEDALVKTLGELSL